MSFQPVLPFTGYSGWLFLNRTLDTQKETFSNTAVIQRDVDYFKENIGSIVSARELVEDRRLLSVALGAFGLDEDLPNKAFIEKVLSDGTIDEDALANKLSDKRYEAFSKAFGFGDLGLPATLSPSFPDTIIKQYEDRQFEIAVGDQNQSLRLALDVDREVANLDFDGLSDDGLWFTIMGTPTLRSVFETALGLPESFSQVDIDTQLETFRERAESIFGDSEVEQFKDPEKQEELVRLFLFRDQLSQTSFATSGSSIALTLLQNI